MAKFQVTEIITNIYMIDDASDAEDAISKSAGMKPQAIDKQHKVRPFVNRPAGLAAPGASAARPAGA